MPNDVVKCYRFSIFFRILGLLFSVTFSILLVNAVIKLISLGLDSVPSVIRLNFFTLIAIPMSLDILVSNIQITGDKLSVVGLLRRRELLLSDISGEFTMHEAPIGFSNVYYFRIPLKSGKWLKFFVGTKKCRDFVLKFLPEK